MHLPLGTSWFLDLSTWWIILQVAIGLGMVIFVHELGHFAVAKWCGVKCEKFYLGFDIYGLKFCKWQRGETEYGIGVLPLGGYVKMLGQDDNPAHARQEMERARIESIPGGAPAPEPVEGEAAMYDPRSYMAQSVPKRMAIISAGVIMNVIFAFIVATVAYGMGVREIRCVVGGVLPGKAAWRADLQPGDAILQIGDVKNPRFRDLQQGVGLGDDIEQGVPLVVKRPGLEEPFELKIVPDLGGLIPMIGMTSAPSRELHKTPVSPYSPLAWLENGFQAGDELIAVNGVAVGDGIELQRELVANPGEITVSVRRAGKSGESSRVVDIKVPAIPMRSVGVAMEIGPIAAVQEGSPAQQAGIRKDDRIRLIDGKPVGDPVSLPHRLALRAGQTVQLTIERDAKQIELPIPLRQTRPYNQLGSFGPLVAADALGVAYAVENRVASIEPGSAAEGKVKVGDEIVAVALVPPSSGDQRMLGIKDQQKRTELKLEADQREWPSLYYALQSTLPGTRLELTFKDERSVTLDPKPVQDWFNPDRGLLFEQLHVFNKAESLSEALSLGWRETGESLGMVFRFLRKIGSQVSVRGMGGPITIAKVAGQSATQGVPELLRFLAMLSANLAVINFLPIPLLDGGHMVFLTLEGIRGKPVSERVVLAFHYVGFLFIISLMLFVLALDFGLISRTT